MHIVFTSEGVMGTPTALKAVAALLNAFVMALVAVAVTDFVAQWVSNEFAAEKFEDDGERAALDMLLEKEADHGVPFNFEDLRLRQANGELSEECYEASRCCGLLQLFARSLARALTLHASRALAVRHLPAGEGDGGAAAGRPARARRDGHHRRGHRPARPAG